MKPRTIMATLVLKLYVGHKRLDTKVSRIILVNEQIQYMQSRYSTHPIQTPNEIKISNKTWSDEISRVLRSRGLHL